MHISGPKPKARDEQFSVEKMCFIRITHSFNSCAASLDTSLLAKSIGNMILGTESTIEHFISLKVLSNRHIAGLYCRLCSEQKGKLIATLQD